MLSLYCIKATRRIKDGWGVQAAHAVCCPGAIGVSEFVLLSSMKSYNYCIICRGQWPRFRSCGSVATSLLGLRVRIPLGHGCPSVVCYRVSHCVWLITRPEESYRVWCVWLWSWSLENEVVLAHYRGRRAMENALFIFVIKNGYPASNVLGRLLS
jgi:hypothetical protein